MGHPADRTQPSRRIVLQTLAAGAAGAAGLLPASNLSAADDRNVVRFAQQPGFLYLPVDTMITGGLLQKAADKAGIGKINATTNILSSPAAVNDALLSGAADYGTISLATFLTLWEKTRGTPNEMRALGCMANGAMTLYTINPNVKTLKDFTAEDKIAVPAVKLSFNSLMMQMAAEKEFNDPMKFLPLEIGIGHPDAVAAMQGGYGKSSITAHIAIQPYTARGLRIPGAHVVTDSSKIFGGPLTQIMLIASKKVKDKDPALFKVVGEALEESIKVANADKLAAARMWKEVQKAPESIEQIMELITDPGFEFTSKPQRIVYFAAFLNRMGRLKATVSDWKDLFWETAYNQQGS